MDLLLPIHVLHMFKEAIGFFSNHRQKEIQANQIRNHHRENHGVGKVEHVREGSGRANDDEQAEDDLVDEDGDFYPIVIQEAEQVDDALFPIVRPRNHGRESKEDYGDC